MVTSIVTAAVIAAAAGFGAGWAVRAGKDDATAEALAEQTRTLEAQGAALAAVAAGQAQIAEAAGRPVVLDAELRATLAQTPVQCRADAGGDARSAACAWATCLQYGQSSAQRPECRAVEAAMLRALEAPGAAPGGR